jgi:hypothetical protein
VHIALLGDAVDAVELLRVADQAKRGDGQHLSLPSGEQAGAVHSREQADFGSQRADLVEPSAVGALAVVDQPSANDVFLKLIHGLVELRGIIRANLIEFFVDGGDDRPRFASRPL